MQQTHKYNNYEDYINFQLKKTSDKFKHRKWLGKEWRLKINIFKKLFNSNLELIQKSKKAICFGSRTGQEVVALKELGIEDTIGIDLHEFKPYTILGDIHNLDYIKDTFDFAFSNILDHSINPEKFISEVYRVLKKNGIFILHIQFGVDQDEYTEVIIENIDNIKTLCKSFKLLKTNEINSGIIAMNYEFVFQKL